MRCRDGATKFQRKSALRFGAQSGSLLKPHHSLTITWRATVLLEQRSNAVLSAREPVGRPGSHGGERLRLEPGIPCDAGHFTAWPFTRLTEDSLFPSCHSCIFA